MWVRRLAERSEGMKRPPPTTLRVFMPRAKPKVNDNAIRLEACRGGNGHTAHLDSCCDIDGDEEEDIAFNELASNLSGGNDYVISPRISFPGLAGRLLWPFVTTLGLMSFEHAPVSKGAQRIRLIVGCALSSITVGLFDVKHYFHLQVGGTLACPPIAAHRNENFSSCRTFLVTINDLFLAVLILYSTGVVIERRFGSIKFARAVCVSISHLRHTVEQQKFYLCSRITASVKPPPRLWSFSLIGVLTGILYRDDSSSRGKQFSGDALREEDVTTARRSEQGGTTTATVPHCSEAAATTGPSVMREWVNELTGRTDRTNAGIRVPTDAEVVQVSTMFPDLDRDVIVAALQRRYVGSRSFVANFPCCTDFGL
ncbi:DSC E3 ubiquitin ligase complex [Salix suchowensis]|nr:DSC E3 ubiquitin ligase complex [Salix suchowensis]